MKMACVTQVEKTQFISGAEDLEIIPWILALIQPGGLAQWRLNAMEPSTTGTNLSP
jgi:hypothetical protein